PAEVYIHHSLIEFVPEGRKFIAQAEVQSQVVPDFELVLRIIGLCPAEQVNMRITASHFGVVADAQQHGSQRKTAVPIQIRSSHGGKYKCSPRNVVREQVQILVTEVHPQLEYVSSADKREIVAIFVSGLDFAQRMSESVFSQVEKIVTCPREVWRAEIDRIVRGSGNSQRGNNIGRARQRANATGINPQPVHPGFIYHAGIDGPTIVNRHGLRFDRFY